MLSKTSAEQLTALGSLCQIGIFADWLPYLFLNAPNVVANCGVVRAVTICQG